MSFGGSVAAMITSLKNNKRERRTAFDKENREYQGVYGKLVDHKKMSPEEFRRFKKQLKADKRKSVRHNYLILGLTIIFVLALLGMLAFGM